MSESQTVYLTTTLPYVNAKPHIGFALEVVQADMLARFYRQLGRSVWFNCGTDEHGQKIYLKAQELNLSPQAYVDQLVDDFISLKIGLNLSYDSFIRTTDQYHIKAAQEFWRRCDNNGDIYQAKYQIKYCVGCELEKTESELVDGRCPIHPGESLELIDEENYFFRFSRYGDKLLSLYDNQPELVMPASRLKEIRSLVASGLKDFSISRLAAKMPWGIPVPGDEKQVMYVWFDALVNYVSAIGWPEQTDQFNRWWPVIQLAGKDNLRQQAAMWQAMLLSAGLPPSRQIMIHGFVNDAEGRKMSKSLGNVVDPLELVAEFNTDVLRYYLLRHIHPFEDSNFSLDKFVSDYNAHLANGLGNLVSRIMTMATRHLSGPPNLPQPAVPTELIAVMAQFEFNQALDIIWQRVGELDNKIQTAEPFKLITVDPGRAKAIIAQLVTELYHLAWLLEPAMPSTSAAIKHLITNHQAPAQPLFARRT